MILGRELSIEESVDALFVQWQGKEGSLFFSRAINCAATCARLSVRCHPVHVGGCRINTITATDNNLAPTTITITCALITTTIL